MQVSHISLFPFERRYYSVFFVAAEMAVKEHIVILEGLVSGDRKALARCITVVENELPGYQEILQTIRPTSVPVVGITGPPGAGKSTLINAMLRAWTDQGKNIGVIAVDPTSPFNYGSLLGDRLRMAEHFNNQQIFIRSLATRGSLGGLSEKIIEIIDVMRSAGFDLIIVETVGVGQSEVEIAGLADTTVVVLVPESGDEIQALKSGIMEIADVFVVNKADREGAEALTNALRKMLHHPKTGGWIIPVIPVIATQSDGVTEFLEQVEKHRLSSGYNEKKAFLLTEKAYQLIRKHRMHDLKRDQIRAEIEMASQSADFNLYTFVSSYNR